MPPALTAFFSDARVRVGAAGLFAIFAAYIFILAGAQDLTFLIVFCALLAFPFKPEPRFWRFKRPPWSLILAIAFLFWAVISASWSPVENKMQALRLALGAPLYALFAFRIGALLDPWKGRVEAGLVFLVFALGFFFFAESLTGGALTTSFKTAVEGYVPGDQHTITKVNQLLGHGVFPFIMLIGPAAAITWREGGPAIGAMLVALGLFSAFSFDLAANSVGMTLAMIAAFVAWRRPRLAVSLAFGLTAGAMLVLPLLLPTFAGLLSDEVRAAMPHSWEWRLEIWARGGEFMRESLWFGHGLDAARPLHAEGELRGVMTDFMPIHPHSAPIQIWLETGLMGVMLAAGGLTMLGGRIAGAPRLSQPQAAAVVWILTIYVVQTYLSYGAWQEWHQSALALAVAMCFFLGAEKPEEGRR
jgi:O-antigen ligase